jgi:hypothetical protein
MDAIREIKKVKGDRITVDLPVRFRNMNVEVIVLPFKQEKTTNGKNEVLITSESALQKDWNLPQEDKAWQSL